MLSIYTAGEAGLEAVADPGSVETLPDTAVWIDLLDPDARDEARVEAWLGIDVPTREEMQEIEISSRIYEEDGAVFMTVLSLLNADRRDVSTTDVTFILKDRYLVTVRHDEPQPLRQFLQRAPKFGPAGRDCHFVFVSLIEAFIDRIADVLEQAGLSADTIAGRIFRHEANDGKPMDNKDFKDIVAAIGRAGDLASKARESLVTISRALVFLSTGPAAIRVSKDVRVHIKTAIRDANQLSDHASYSANKAVFLLDATVGLINIEQTNIIKIFSVAAVAMMPPTMIASIYGMNFQFMPELHAVWGYPVSLIVMILSAVAPYVYFKRKGWL